MKIMFTNTDEFQSRFMFHFPWIIDSNCLDIDYSVRNYFLIGPPIDMLSNNRKDEVYD